LGLCLCLLRHRSKVLEVWCTASAHVKVEFLWQTTTMTVVDVCIQIGAEIGTVKVPMKLANTYIIQTYISLHLKRPLIFIQLLVVIYEHDLSMYIIYECMLVGLLRTGAICRRL